MDTMTLSSNTDTSLCEEITRLSSAVDFCGYFSAADASSLKALAGSEQALLNQLLPLAQQYSHAPISNFHVGAVALAHSGAIYLGANREFPGCPLSQSIHAEQSVISHAWHHQEKGLRMLAITAAPCGHCRQFINELKNSGDIEILLPQQAPMNFRSLLPHSFGPEDLAIDDHLMCAQPHTMAYPGNDPLISAACDAANNSYAPYTDSPAAIALQTSRGTYLGRYAENCAYNPSLGPLQAALNELALAKDDLADLKRAVLVEASGSPVSQQAISHSLLNTLSEVSLEVLQLTLADRHLSCGAPT